MFVSVLDRYQLAAASLAVTYPACCLNIRLCWCKLELLTLNQDYLLVLFGTGLAQQSVCIDAYIINTSKILHCGVYGHVVAMVIFRKYLNM